MKEMSLEFLSFDRNERPVKDSSTGCDYRTVDSDELTRCGGASWLKGKEGYGIDMTASLWYDVKLPIPSDLSIASWR